MLAAVEDCWVAVVLPFTVRTIGGAVPETVTGAELVPEAPPSSTAIKVTV